MVKATLPKGYKAKDRAATDSEGRQHMHDGTVWSNDGSVHLNPNKIEEGGQTAPPKPTPHAPSFEPPTNVADKDRQIEELKARLAEMEAKAKAAGAHGGRTIDNIVTAGNPTAGKYPANTADMPTLDDVNGTTGTAEASGGRA